MTISQTVRLTVCAALLCVSSMACTSTTAPAVEDSGITELVFNTETFAAALQVKGTTFYSFFVNQAGPVGLTLAAVQAPGGAALSTPLGIGVGIPAGTGCTRSTSQISPPGLAAQMTVTLNPGTYCAAVFDSGNLTSAVNFAMRIRHP